MEASAASAQRQTNAIEADICLARKRQIAPLCSLSEERHKLISLTFGCFCVLQRLARKLYANTKSQTRSDTFTSEQRFNYRIRATTTDASAQVARNKELSHVRRNIFALGLEAIGSTLQRFVVRMRVREREREQTLLLYELARI